MRVNASKYGLDTPFLGTTGDSSGGYLSALMVTSGGVIYYTVGQKPLFIEGNVGGYSNESSRVDPVVDWYGPTNFQKMDSCGSKQTHDAKDSPKSILIGGPIQENNNLFKLGLAQVSMVLRKGTCRRHFNYGEQQNGKTIERLIYEQVEKIFC